jgi:hypothetical protein
VVKDPPLYKGHPLPSAILLTLKRNLRSPPLFSGVSLPDSVSPLSGMGTTDEPDTFCAG